MSSFHSIKNPRTVLSSSVLSSVRKGLNPGHSFAEDESVDVLGFHGVSGECEDEAESNNVHGCLFESWGR